MYYDPPSFNRVSIRINPYDINKTLTLLKKHGWI